MGKEEKPLTSKKFESDLALTGIIILSHRPYLLCSDTSGPFLLICALRIWGHRALLAFHSSSQNLTTFVQSIQVYVVVLNCCNNGPPFRPWSSVAPIWKPPVYKVKVKKGPLTTALCFLQINLNEGPDCLLHHLIPYTSVLTESTGEITNVCKVPRSVLILGLYLRLGIPWQKTLQ